MIYTGNQEKKADYYDQIYKNGYNTSNYNFLYQEVINILSNLDNPRVLELGCGLGDLGKMIMEKGWQYRGFDFSQEAIKICKDKSPQGNFYQGNVYDNKSFGAEDYNTVIALEVFEHVDDLSVIENIRPGATVIGSVPNYDDSAHLRLYEDGKADIVDYYKPYMHVYDIRSAQINNNSSGEVLTMHLFTGIKKAD